MQTADERTVTAPLGKPKEDSMDSREGNRNFLHQTIQTGRQETQGWTLLPIPEGSK